MIIIPEIETVYIRIPKTASKSMTKAIRAKYPRAFEPYRHMEITGVPQGYERWCSVTVMRDPAHRMESLYKFCRNVKDKASYGLGWAAVQREAASAPFSSWFINNQVPFCSPRDSFGNWNPFWQIRYEVGENLKSQSLYVNDKTEIYAFEHLDKCAARLGIELPERKHNESSDEVVEWSDDARRKLHSRMGADFRMHYAAWARETG